MLAIPARVISTCFAFAAFIVCLLAGTLAGRSASQVLIESLLVMVGCWLVGTPLARLMQQTIEHHIHQYAQSHPVPSETEPGTDIHAPSINTESDQEIEPNPSKGQPTGVAA